MRLPVLVVVALLAVLTGPQAAQAATSEGAVISNGTVQLGITAEGALNYDCEAEADTGCPTPSLTGRSAVGLRFVPLNADGTSPGCLCEGWGMADAASGLTGSANEQSGVRNVTVDAFTAAADGRSAVSTVTIADASKPDVKMQVTHDYHPSPRSPNLYEVRVSVTNTGTKALEDLRYRRVMDWDVEPTAFREWVTVSGSSKQLLFNSDDGFASSDPLAAKTYINAESVCGTGYTGPCSYTDLGDGGERPTATEPDDHGALFDFGLGSLAPGETKRFFVLYGAAPTEAAALAATEAAGAEVWSFGQSNCPDPSPNGNTATDCASLRAGAGPADGRPVTFIFGFVTSTADIALTKTGTPATVTAGGEITYSLQATNRGPDQASGVQVVDTLPAGVELRSVTASQGTCAAAGATVTCDLDVLPSGASATITLVVRTTAPGDLLNTAEAGAASADPDPANNRASAATKVTPPPPVVEPPVVEPPVQQPKPSPLLACTARKLVLIDVVPGASRVTLLGAADPRLAGRTVDVVFTATNKRVARATVGPDGTFQSTAPLPPRSIRTSSRARYQARIGTERSEQLKLVRRVIVTSIRSAAGRVTLKGRVTPPLGRPIQSVAVQQRVSCAANRVVKRFKPRANGSFSVTFPAPAGETAAVYVLRTKVRNSAGSNRLYLTKSLPRPVTIR